MRFQHDTTAKFNTTAKKKKNKVSSFFVICKTILEVWKGYLIDALQLRKLLHLFPRISDIKGPNWRVGIKQQSLYHAVPIVTQYSQCCMEVFRIFKLCIEQLLLLITLLHHHIHRKGYMVDELQLRHLFHLFHHFTNIKGQG
jgi:hypothetical protein